MKGKNLYHSAMSWPLKYTITNRLASTIRLIGETIAEVRQAGLTDNTFARLEHQARELSSFASTSIKGNPLPLTDVKNLLKNAPVHVRDTEREVLNYNRALENIYRSVKSGSFKLRNSPQRSPSPSQPPQDRSRIADLFSILFCSPCGKDPSPADPRQRGVRSRVRGRGRLTRQLHR